MRVGKQDGGVVRKLSVPLRALAGALVELPAPGMLIGGLAAILHGAARVTRDVDVTVIGGGGSVDDLVAGLGRHGFIPRPRAPSGR